MPKKSIHDPPTSPASSIPSFTQGINALLKCVTSVVPRMEWMSQILTSQIETTLNANLLTDPLGNLPPVVRETLLQLPEIAWPTILLFAVNVLVMLSVVVLREFAWISYFAASFILTCCMFVMFTVAHDAAHGSISKDFKWINEVIGRFSFGCLGPLGCFTIWKWLHQMHHKFTNHPEKDPDRFCSGGNVILLPLRCLVLPLYQFWFYMHFCLTRPVLEVLELASHLTVNMMIIYKCIQAGYTTEVFCYWIIPSVLALSLLAFLFDFIPHHDNDATPIESRFQTTSLLKTYPVLQPLLTLLLQYQDYHLIHHLYPTIPFYRYANKWQEKQKFLIEKNVPVKYLTL